MKIMKIMKIMLSLVMALGFSLGNLTAGFGAEAIKLPPPATKGTVSVEEAFKTGAPPANLPTVPWNWRKSPNCCGPRTGSITPRARGPRPPARAAYAVDLYLVVGERGVTNLAPGIYRYLVADQALELVAKGEFRPAVAKACNSQAWIGRSPGNRGDYRGLSPAAPSRMGIRRRCSPTWSPVFSPRTFFSRPGPWGWGPGSSGV